MSSKAFNMAYPIPAEGGAHILGAVPLGGRLVVKVVNVGNGPCSGIHTYILGALTIPAQEISPEHVYIIGPGQSFGVVAAGGATDRSLQLVGWFQSDENQCGDDMGLDFDFSGGGGGGGGGGGNGTDYVVMFVDMSGQTLYTENVPPGGSATPPVPPDEPGYTFTHWQGTYENVQNNSSVQAMYESISLNTYEIVFVNANNVPIHTEIVAHGGNATAPDGPTMPGYTFTQWVGEYTNVQADATIIPLYDSVTDDNIPSDLTGDKPLTMEIYTGANETSMTTFRLPFINFTGTIDWGDGNQSQYNGEDNPVHFYNVSNTYMVKVVGHADYAEIVEASVDRQLRDIVQWGTNFTMSYYGDSPDGDPASVVAGLLTARKGFTISAVDAPQPTTPSCFHGMFYGCTEFNDDISHWNMTGQEDISKMFAYATSFNKPLDAWDMSTVRIAGFLFYNADAFNQPLDSWSAANWEYIEGMFYGAASFNQNINSWNVSLVETFSKLFWGCDAFNQPLDQWDVSNVTVMRSCFERANVFNQNINGWDVSSVIDFANMFRNTDTFNLPLANWNVAAGTMFDGMFFGAVFNQDITSWAVEQSDAHHEFKVGGYLTDANTPCPFWDDPSQCVQNFNSVTMLDGAIQTTTEHMALSDVAILGYAVPEDQLFDVHFDPPPTVTPTIGSIAPLVFAASVSANSGQLTISYGSNVGVSGGEWIFGVAIYRHADSPVLDNVTGDLYGERITPWQLEGADINGGISIVSGVPHTGAMTFTNGSDPIPAGKYTVAVAMVDKIAGGDTLNPLPVTHYCTFRDIELT